MTELDKCTRLDRLVSEWSISYNGYFLDSIPPKRGSVTGVVLTRYGELVTRSSRRYDWEKISAPNVYLFYDNDSNATFKVYRSSERIKEVQPFGRIFDCTDKILYEVIDANWHAICDFECEKEISTIVKCTNAVRIPGTTSVSVNLIGNQPVIDSLSEIQNVIISGNTAIISSLPNDNCAVLMYTTCVSGPASSEHWSGKIVRVALIILFDISTDLNAIFKYIPRFSAQNGVISGTPVSSGAVAVGSVIVPIPFLTLAVAINLTAPINPNFAFPINSWITEHYDLPTNQFDPPTGIMLTQRGGQYHINVNLSHALSGIVTFGVVTTITDGVITSFTPRSFIPFFALLVNGVIRAIAPLTTQRITIGDLLGGFLGQPILPGTTPIIGPIFEALGQLIPGLTPGGITGITTSLFSLETFNINEVGQANIDIGLTLNVGDTVRIVYVDDPTSAATIPFSLVGRLGLADSTFNVQWIGP